MIDVYLRGPDLLRAELIDVYSSFDLVDNWASTANWSIDLTGTDTAVARRLLAARDDDTLWQYGVIVDFDDGRPSVAGPFRMPTAQLKDSVFTRKLSGFSDKVWLERTTAWPAPYPYTSADYDTPSGHAETVAKQLVGNNLGPSAASGRRLPGLQLEADTGRGSSVSVAARWKPVMGYVQEALLAGGDLGHDIIPVGDHREYVIYEMRDRTQETILSVDYDTLAGYSYGGGVPEANYVYVLGQGEGAARTVREGGDDDSINRYGRIEIVVDRRDTNAPDLLDQTVRATLLEKAAPASVAIEPVDDLKLAPRLGDIFTAQVDDVRVTNAIRQVHYQHKPGKSFRVSPVLGSPGASNPNIPNLFAQRRADQARIAQLEVR